MAPPPAEAQPASSIGQRQPGPWQRRAQQLRDCLADPAAALKEARMRAAPHLSDLFASADEASAALLETDAERAAFVALAEANATPGTGVALRPAELAERAAVPAQLCETLGSTYGTLFHVDPAGRISLAADIPAVAYSLSSSRSGVPTVRRGPMVLKVPLVLRRVRRLTFASMGTGLRKAVTQLSELSDEAVWVMAAGLRAFLRPKGFRTPPVQLQSGVAAAAQGGPSAAVAAYPTRSSGSAVVSGNGPPAGSSKQLDGGAADAAPSHPAETVADAAPGSDMASPSEQAQIACAVPEESAGTSLGKFRMLTVGVRV